MKPLTENQRALLFCFRHGHTLRCYYDRGHASYWTTRGGEVYKQRAAVAGGLVQRRLVEVVETPSEHSRVYGLTEAGQEAGV